MEESLPNDMFIGTSLYSFESDNILDEMGSPNWGAVVGMRENKRNIQLTFVNSRDIPTEDSV